MKRAVIFAVVAVSLLTIGLIAAIASNYGLFNGLTQQKPFYVGVTYCGNSTQDAKLLVDRVKNYTNLFVLQSGPLMTDEAAVKDIGNYAVSCGLHFAAMFDTSVSVGKGTWIGLAEQWWGDKFAGVYYGDEPGGKMLDATVTLFENPSERITKYSYGSVMVSETGLTITYTSNGVVNVKKRSMSSFGSTDIYYYPNGSITYHESGGDVFTTENGSDVISQLESYDEWLSKYPFPNCDAVAEKFVKSTQRTIDGLNTPWSLNQSFPIFTSDYALFWWDYQSGYDMVLAQLGWNNTAAQEIGLVRGAANLQNKRWGTIITWTYDKPPYLTDGNEMYEQLRMSYEAGAEYVMVFNYAADMQGPYGILQDEHFDALERFWNDIVKNLTVVHGGIEAEAAFVLPKNYGWGLRRLQDSVWGLWEPNEEARQAWPRLQEAVTKHGLKLDIVCDDPAYPFAGKYRQVYYWNQTS